MSQQAPPGLRSLRFPYAARIVAALCLGLAAGLVFRDGCAPLARLGTIILDLIKGLAAPLLVFAILDTFLRTELRLRAGARLLTIVVINATCAIGIGLAISNLLQPGHSLRLGEAGVDQQARSEFDRMKKAIDPDRRIDILQDVLRHVPTSIARPFVENELLSIVILAVLGGAALRVVKHEQTKRGETAYLAVESLVATVYRASEVVMRWVVQLVPIAVFGVVASTVGKYGLKPLGGLAVYLAVGLVGLGIQVFLVYQTWIAVVAKRRLGWFWSGAREAVVYAMGTASSLATLPVTLKSLDRMNVSPQSARLAACVGTNLNNDGILLYEAMAVLFVAQACGISLDVGQQLVAVVSCLIAGIGISGIPDAGLISLLLVLKSVRIVPDEQIATVVPLLLTVDWIMGRARAMTNVTSDMVCAVVLDRFERQESREKVTPTGIEPVSRP